MTLTVACHHLAQARAALGVAAAAGTAIDLASARGMAAYAGVAFLHAMEQALGRPLLIDCGKDAGLALGALRQSLKRLLFTGDPVVLAKLRDMAGQVGATVADAWPEGLVELEPRDEGAWGLRRRLKVS